MRTLSREPDLDAELDLLLFAAIYCNIIGISLFPTNWPTKGNQLLEGGLDLAGDHNGIDGGKGISELSSMLAKGASKSRSSQLEVAGFPTHPPTHSSKD